ncbi:unnamed protein product [Mytilus coruscus]|uniref:Uncharacterized protein n=1 Tax=Mytilus coruscus TaxID=42192 RepID=A0A6J8BBN9_MYTCO|nr:unnamed protein product [Mytilus coruscus]
MAKIDRSRMTISANIILTVSLITRTLTFGFIFISIYIKVKDDILDEEVIKVVDMEVIAGMPLGSTVKSIIFSLIGVFVVELITGIFGMWGAFGRKKRLLAVKTDLYYTLLNYTSAYRYSLVYGYEYISYWNRVETFPEFMQKIAGLGLIGLGLTLIGDVFITDGSLRHIFYKMQFYHYYFYDILVGLAAASVVIGICTSLVAVLGLVGSWRKSKPFLITINNGMKFQLWLQQLGYFYGGSGNRITGHWNNMIMTLQCCGVNYYSETHTTQGIQFCCKNANPRILDKEDPNTNSNYGLFDYFGGCGGYKTDTCAEVILFKTKMFVGWFLAIVLLQIVLEAAGLLCSVLVANIVQTGLWGKFLAGTECCGVGSLIESSFTSTYWYSYGDRSSRRIPVQCCKSQSDVFPYADRYDSHCTNSMLDGYFNTQSCDDAVEKRLKTYSIIFFVFMTINILTEMCCVIIIVYNGLRFKKDSKKLHLDVKAVDNTKEIKIEIEKHMLEPSMENEALKSRKKKKKKSKSGKISQTNKSKSRESIELQKKEHTIIQEQPVNTTELQPIKSMEMENKEKADGESKQVDTISRTNVNDAEEVDTLAENNTTVSDTQIRDANEITNL